MFISDLTIPAFVSAAPGADDSMQVTYVFEKMRSLEKQNEELQQLICYLLRKNESLRTLVCSFERAH